MIARTEQIRSLLRAARERLDPTEVGLPSEGRRRSVGLRREDVAALASVSVKWYTWLEQGRDMRFSPDLLERIAKSLRLSSAEREYLFGLLQKRLAPSSEHEDALTDNLWRTIEFLPVPALVMTLRWDIVAWNDLIARIFRDYEAIPAKNRNLLRIALTDKGYQSDPDDYDVMIRRLLAKFRLDFSQCAGDPSFEELVAELKRDVPNFDYWWRNMEVSDSLQGRSLVEHAELGELDFDRSSYMPEGSAFLRVVMLIPRDLKTASVIASLRAMNTGARGLNGNIHDLTTPLVFRHRNPQSESGMPPS